VTFARAEKLAADASSKILFETLGVAFMRGKL